MPSGKQLSFISGEVAPSLRFRTDQASYAKGLSKLLNGLIRKSGGVSNRPGFEFFTKPTGPADVYQQERGILDSIRIFGVKFAEDHQYLVGLLSYDLTSIWVNLTTGVVTNILMTPMDLNNVKLSVYDNLAIFSNGETHRAFIFDKGLGLIAQAAIPVPTVIAPGGPIALPTTGYTEFVASFHRPVSYRVYQEQTNGDEVLYYEIVRGTVADGGGLFPPFEPHANLYSHFDIELYGGEGIRHYNVYRATRDANDLISNWGLVGRMSNPGPVGPTLVTFRDYVASQDVTTPPPDEDYLYGFDAMGNQSFRLVGHYQERRVLVHNEEFSQLDEGSVAVSKAGAPKMLHTYTIFRDIGAFDFKVPMTIQGQIIAMLEMERLILFTEDKVVVILGNEAGILTPSTVNPTVIGDMGCSKDVTPVSASTRGFFMSKNNDKMMSIRFTGQGIALQDISSLSEHLVEGAVVRQLAVTKNKEDTVWALLSNGTLVSAVVSDVDAEVGWKRHDTDGFIESIAAVSVPRTLLLDEREPTYDALFISVVREDVRYFERLSYREEKIPEQMTYADSFTAFGTRLKYLKATNSFDQDRLNIEGGPSWAKEETLTVRAIGSTPFTNPASLSRRIDFYYDDDNAEGETITKKLRFVPTAFVSTSELTGYFEEDVPAELQDSEAVAPTNKLYLQTRWAFADNVVTGLTHLANKEVSVFAEGTVVSSPNNPLLEDVLEVDGAGELQLDDYYTWGIVGLPYDFEMETLDLDTADGRTFTDSKKLITAVGIALHESRGGFVGQTGSGKDLQNLMDEVLRRGESETLEEISKNISKHLTVNFPADWEPTGRVLIKHVDPTPITVLAVYPKGLAGD